MTYIYDITYVYIYIGCGPSHRLWQRNMSGSSPKVLSSLPIEIISFKVGIPQILNSSTTPCRWTKHPQRSHLILHWFGKHSQLQIWPLHPHSGIPTDGLKRPSWASDTKKSLIASNSAWSQSNGGTSDIESSNSNAHWIWKHHVWGEYVMIHANMHINNIYICIYHLGWATLK